MKIDYQVTGGQCASSELGVYFSYGIAAVADGQRAIHISDISLDKASVEQICWRLNQFEAESVHFRDIVLDSLE